MDRNSLYRGRVAFSKQGRDKGKFYIISDNASGLCGESEFFYVVDGDKRKLVNPKKKRKKHLGITKKVFDIGFGNNPDGTKDALIRKLLKA